MHTMSCTGTLTFSAGLSYSAYVVLCGMSEQKDEAETCQYAEVVSTRMTDRPQPSHRPAPLPPVIYAQITHPPTYVNQQPSLGFSTE